MKKNAFLLILTLLMSSNISAALLYSSGNLANDGDFFDPYSASSRSYDSSLGNYVSNTFTFDLNITPITRIDRIEYHVLTGSYNFTDVEVSNTNTENLIYGSSVVAQRAYNGGYNMYSFTNGSIGSAYTHTLNDLGILVNTGEFTLSLTLDSNYTSYLGTTLSDNVAIKVYGESNITPVPLPPSIWLFAFGLLTLIRKRKF